jgi:hypothetical protein
MVEALSMTGKFDICEIVIIRTSLGTRPPRVEIAELLMKSNAAGGFYLHPTTEYIDDNS